MKDDYLNRLDTALSKAGFLITKYSFKPWKGGQVKLRVQSFKQEKTEYPETINHSGQRTAGETYDLVRFLNAQDWRHAFNLVQEAIRAGRTDSINAGDFIRVSFEVPAAEYQGVSFKKLIIKDAMVRIFEIVDDRVIFNFDDILFKSAINAKDTNAGGFDGSALADYLNNEFLNAMGISDVLLANNNDSKITLLTAHELFGDSEYWEATSNFQKEPHQMDCFKNEKNRIKSFENETQWYWTSSERASSAAYFCICNSYGSSGSHYASSVGGVAPAFCVA
jgi:hypothetical protein